MYFKVNDEKLLKKYNKKWERVSNFLSVKLDIQPVYGDNGKDIKTKIKFYEDKVNTNFQGKKIPKENASYKCLSLITLDSVIRANKKYYHQALLEESKYDIKNNKMENLIINNDLDLSSSDESHNESRDFSWRFLRQNKAMYNHIPIVNIYIAYGLIPTTKDSSITLENCLFAAVKLTKNSDIGKFKYSAYGIGFDSKGSFSQPRGGYGRNLGADISSSIQQFIQKKCIQLILL